MNWKDFQWWVKGAYNDDDDDDDDDDINNDDNNNNIKFKTSMIRSSLCDYSDAYILVKETKTVPNTVVTDVAVNNTK